MMPIIGITTFEHQKNSSRFNALSISNTQSVIMAGATPVMLPITRDKTTIKEYAKKLDGIIFSGGEDISPVVLGLDPIREVNSISPDRDFFEIELYKEAVRLDIPMLGICRGAQIINVAAGGSIYQDIYKEHEGTHGHNPSNIPGNELYHKIEIEGESILFDIFKHNELFVNSFHHQAVNILAKGFKASAKARDGIIEAIEAENNTFIMGLQFHPEILTSSYPEFLKIYEYFIDKCSKKN